MKNIIKKIFLSVGALGLVIGSVFGINAIIKANKEESPLIVGGIEENGIRLRQNKVSTNGTLSVTATVSPSYANDKTLSWSLDWKSSTTGLPTGYVTITPSDDTLTCTVEVKKAFRTQIILTCTSQANSMAKASCTIDYVGRSLQYKKDTLPTDYDFKGENLSDYTLDELLIDVLGLSLDSSQWETSGGTLIGVGKDLSITSYKIANAEVSERNRSIEQYLVGKYGDLATALSSTNGTLNISVTIGGNVYYNNTKVGTATALTLTTSVYFDLTAYGPTGITLNDSSLIF